MSIPLFLIILATPLFGNVSEYVLHSFAGPPNDGALPMAGLLFDETGSAYGTTTMGGVHNFGTVFKLSPSPSGLWTETVIYSFMGLADGDGAGPFSGIIADGSGSIYGATVAGGQGRCVYAGFKGCGVIYKLTPPMDPGGIWTESVLYKFTGGTDGANPAGNLIIDNLGSIYGTTVLGGAFGAGTVFNLISSEAMPWSESVVHSFNPSSEGGYPAAGVAFDRTGKLWGTTTGGGQGYGTVFYLQPSERNQDAWTEKVVYTFTNGTDGGVPGAEVIFDENGKVYGTTTSGGRTGSGTVYRLSLSKDRLWRHSVIHDFFNDGSTPEGALLMDTQSHLYGTTHGGGHSFAGIVFELTSGSVQTLAPWAETTLYSFMDGIDGGLPDCKLVFGTDGALYGTTYVGGDTNHGTVFALRQ